MTDRRAINRRKRVFVHGIQRKYLLLALVPLIISSFLIILFLFMPLDLLVISRSSEAQRAQLITQLRALGVRVWPAIFLSMVISALLSIFVTHHIGGPVFRFEETARRMAEGDFSVRVQLRQGDDFRELEELMNQVLGRVGTAMAAIRAGETAIGGALSALQREVRAGRLDAQALEARIAEALRHHGEVESALAAFKMG